MFLLSYYLQDDDSRASARAQTRTQEASGIDGSEFQRMFMMHDISGPCRFGCMRVALVFKLVLCV